MIAVAEREAGSAVIRHGDDDGEGGAGEHGDLPGRLVSGLSAERMEGILVRGRVHAGLLNRVQAFYLHEMDLRREHQTLGYASTVQFAHRRLEMSRRKARDLIETGRALRELERVDEAYREGRISWTKTRLLARIAVPETELAWLERALELTCKALEREVAQSEKGRPPRSDRRGLPALKYPLKLQLDAVLHEAWAMTKKKLSLEAGEEMPEQEVLRKVCELALRAVPPEGADASRSDDSLFRLVVDYRPHDGTASLRTDDGPVLLSERQTETVLRQAPPAVDLDEDGRSDVQDLVLPHGTDKETSVAERKYVLARDGYRCRHCGSKEDLHAHHVIFRSEGGRSKRQNLVTLCSRCHTLAHEGLLKISGRAPLALHLRDRRGRGLEGARGLELRPSEKLGHEGGACAPPEIEKRPVSFDVLPREAGADWWLRHRHLFEWKERKGTLEFEAGPALESVASEDRVALGRGVSLADIIGQERVVRNLETAVVAAKARGNAVRHILLQGPPGLGKTTLARAAATEMGARAWTASGVAIQDPASLVSLLLEMGEKDVLFVDEIHALPRKVAEMLYEAMEDLKLSLLITCGTRTRTLTLQLRPFTLVGATTNPERVPAPLVARFGPAEEMDYYEEEQLMNIVKRGAVRENLQIDEAAARVLAQASLGTPRTALRLLGRAVDAGVARARHLIAREDALLSLVAAGLDRTGLGTVHRRALEKLRELGGPIGVNRLAALIGIARSTFRCLYVPDLLRLNLVAVTPRGLVTIGGTVSLSEAPPCTIHT